MQHQFRNKEQGENQIDNERQRSCWAYTVDGENMTNVKDASEMKPVIRTKWCRSVPEVEAWLVVREWICSMSYPRQKIRKLAIAITMAIGWSWNGELVVDWYLSCKAARRTESAMPIIPKISRLPFSRDSMVIVLMPADSICAEKFRDITLRQKEDIRRLWECNYDELE